MSEPVYIDIGNSMIKAAVRKGSEWSLLYRERSEEPDLFFRWLSEQNRPVRICSVHSGISRRLRSLSEDHILEIDASHIPIDRLDYKTTRTLGLDRFFSCMGAVRMAPSDVVVIDAGTACTVDYMTADTIFRGGVIMPGLEVIQQMFATRFPDLSGESFDLPEDWPGRSTSESVRWGTTGLFAEGIRGFLRKYLDKYGPFRLYLTGGESGLVLSLIEDEWQGRLRPYLIFDGMEAADREFNW